MRYALFLLLLIATACTETSENSDTKTLSKKKKELTAAEKYYQLHVNDSIQSESIGSVSNGQLKNATLIPFEGNNYSYFDLSSYMGGRAFTHSTVASITMETYESLAKQGVTRHFKVMEFSRKEGGKIFPHRTHQNGLSVDFMMPLQKDGKPYYALDNKGASHYLMEFDENGYYSEDKSISIDFEMAARHILELDKQARKQGMKIHKVIFNTHLKDELFAGRYGQQLKSSGIYVTRNLSKMINDLHDDHYHVDFTFK